MALEKEYEVFKQKLPELLRTLKGKFVLIHGDDMDGSWDDENAAYTAGCQKYGTDPFLVRLVADRGEETRTDGDFPAVGTPEWGRMNQRRAELIRKKNRQGLSSDEQVEYERLQRLSHEALETRFPRPSLHSDPDGGRR